MIDPQIKEYAEITVKIFFGFAFAVSMILIVIKTFFKLYQKKDLELGKQKKEYETYRQQKQKEKIDDICHRMNGFETEVGSLSKTILSSTSGFQELRERLDQTVQSSEKVASSLYKHSGEIKAHLKVVGDRLKIIEEDAIDLHKRVDCAEEALKIAEKNYFDARDSSKSSEKSREEASQLFIKCMRVVKQARELYEAARMNVEKSRIIKIGADLYMFKKIEDGKGTKKP